MLFLDRVQKLKDARTQAEKEIDEYKQTKETEFKQFEQSVRGPYSPDAVPFTKRH